MQISDLVVDDAWCVVLLINDNDTCRRCDATVNAIRGKESNPAGKSNQATDQMHACLGLGALPALHFPFSVLTDAWLPWLGSETRAPTKAKLSA